MRVEKNFAVVVVVRVPAKLSAKGADEQRVVNNDVKGLTVGKVTGSKLKQSTSGLSRITKQLRFMFVAVTSLIKEAR